MAEFFPGLRATTTLLTGINSSVTSLTIVPVAGSPTTAQFRIRIDDEWMLATAVSGGSNETYTVTRGIEGTTAASHTAGATVYYILTPLGLGGQTDPAAATPGLRSLGTGAQQAAAGNDARLSDARVPTAHASSHHSGGSDPLAGQSIAGLLTSSTPVFAGLTSANLIGGTGTGSSLELRSTSGVGATDFIKLTVGNNGATEAMRILNNGMVGIGISPTRRLHVYENVDGGPGAEFVNPNTGTGAFATFKSTADVASINVIAHGSGRVATRYGVTLGSMVELFAQTGSGLLIGTGANAQPVVLGTNNAERIRIDSAGGIGFGVTSPTAALHLKAGTATASTAPLKFTSGTNLTTAETGAMEYDGTNLFFTRTGTTRESVICSNAVNSVSPTTPDRTITVVIAGATLYLHAKTTND